MQLEAAKIVVSIKSGVLSFVLWVIKRTVFSFYPDLGDLKYKLIFNGKILPRVKNDNETIILVYINILFCRKLLVQTGVSYEQNLYVP